MKLKMTCPKCNSVDVDIAENTEDITPQYKCNKCGHKGSLFPQFGNKTKKEEY